MLGLLRSISYVPILKWKEGERRALATTRAPQRARVLPLFLMPPSGDYDHEKKRRLTPLEHIVLFGKRLHDSWGRLPVFVDAIGIDDREHSEGLSVHPLTELLARAHAAKALACPATTMDRSPSYQEAVRRFAIHHPHLPICIRVNPLDDMESGNFAADFFALIERLGCSASRVFLILDFASLGAPKVSEIEAFTKTAADRIFHALELAPWLKLATAFTSFPTELKMKRGVKLFPRTDWAVYRHLIDREPALLQRVAFGDYAVDSAPFRKPKGRPAPSAHLRYTTLDNYLIVKGLQAKKPVGYSAIFPVADILVGRDEFAGITFSEGDAFIHQLAARDPEASTGRASTWRWAGTDHHFSRVLTDLGVLAGQRQPNFAPDPDGSVQATLF